MWAGGRQAAQKLTERERFMRVGRLAAVAAGIFALIAVTPASPKPTTMSTQAVVVVRPGVIHIAGQAQAAPLTTAACEKDFSIACYGPARSAGPTACPRCTPRA